MTALCKNDLSSDLNSTFGFRFFANKPPPRLCASSPTLTNSWTLTGRVVHDAKPQWVTHGKKSPAFPFIAKGEAESTVSGPFGTLWNYTTYTTGVWYEKRIIRIPITQLMWRIEGKMNRILLFLANLNQRLNFSYTRKFDLGQSKNWARRCKR